MAPPGKTFVTSSISVMMAEYILFAGELFHVPMHISHTLPVFANCLDKSVNVTKI
jgi:hypothetical protein